MSVEIIQGDWVEELRKLPSNWFHAACTSPPYWKLRSYLPKDHPLKPLELGSEKTVEEYVQKLVEGFREMRRTLRDDGCFWINLGDAYSGSGKGGNPPDSEFQKQATNRGSEEFVKSRRIGRGSGRWGGGDNAASGCKPKDLIGLPWLVAFALRADGWYLRSACPWVKRSTMPESVEDRPGSACEMIFLFSKTADYFYDAEAVRLPGRIPAGTRGAKASAERAAESGVNSRPSEYATYSGTRNRRNSDWFWDTWQGLLPDENGDPVAFVVNPRPFKGAHFACFPPTLIEPMVKAGTSEKGCCMLCGAPWERIVEKVILNRESPYDGSKFNGTDPNFSHTRIQMMVTAGRAAGLPHDNPQPERKTIGWKSGCECGADLEPMPCRVLDPFGGAGTTAMVCNKLGRDYTIIELNPEYIPMAAQRVAGGK